MIRQKYEKYGKISKIAGSGQELQSNDHDPRDPADLCGRIITYGGLVLWGIWKIITSGCQTPISMRKQRRSSKA